MRKTVNTINLLTNKWQEHCADELMQSLLLRGAWLSVHERNENMLTAHVGTHLFMLIQFETQLGMSVFFANFQKEKRS